MRFVAQGNKGGDKPYIVCDIATLRSSSFRLILYVSALCKLRLIFHDLTRACLQSKYNLTRKTCIQPKPDDISIFGLQTNELFELNKPLYGIYEAGDYWGVTLEEHIINDLGMSPLADDSELYLKHRNGALVGITGSHVDNSLHTEYKESEALAEATLETFEAKPRLCGSFDFFGTQISTIKVNTFSVLQKYYDRSLD